MPRRGRTLRRNGRRGVAATELAVLLPVLLLIVLGCIDFGRCAYTYIALVNATRAGAQYAIMNPFLPSQQATWEGQIQQKARDEMYQQTGYNSNNLTTTAAVTIEGTGLRRVRVVASYGSFTTLVSWPGIPSSITLQAAVVLRVIR